jgi:hypothetical protein
MTSIIGKLLQRLHRCDGCWRSLRRVAWAPILRPETWRKIADERDVLCGDCMFRRARDRKIEITFGDLWPCPFNLRPSPHSWFELFLSQEENQQLDLSDWRDVIRYVADRHGHGRTESILGGPVPAILRESAHHD